MCVLVCVYDMCVSVGLVMTHYSCRGQRAAWVVGMVRCAHHVLFLVELSCRTNEMVFFPNVTVSVKFI